METKTPVKITALQEENFKRIRAVALEPTPNGLTVIGGRNAQGKTSVLDGICAALGGAKYMPTAPTRDGSATPAKLRVTLSNGIVVERSGKNASLRITDPSGAKGGQKLLDSFIEPLALDLPRFMQASPAEKAGTLLKVIGVGDKLADLDRREKMTYDERTQANRDADRFKKTLDSMPYYPQAPEEEVSVSKLIVQQQEILARNGENQKLRLKAEQIRDRLQRQEQYVKDLTAKLREAEDLLTQLQVDSETASRTAEDLQDGSTAELEDAIRNAETTNMMVKANRDRQVYVASYEAARAESDDLTKQLEGIRAERKALLDSAPLPLPGLAVEAGELAYNGKRWDGMSGAEQLRVACAIVRAIKPECGFVLMDGLESMDMHTLQKFAEWAYDEGLQIIATRVSTSGEGCTVVIEDGYIEDGHKQDAAPTDSTVAEPPAPPAPKWTFGTF